MATEILDSFKKARLNVANIAANGPIGTAATTVDNFSVFAINQTTANITVSLPNPTVTDYSDVVEILNVGTASFKVSATQSIEPNQMGSATWTGTAWVFETSGLNYNLGTSNLIAKTPFQAPPETVVAFDGFEIKWHNSSASSYDGIALRVTSGTRLVRYHQTEFYLANAATDSGRSIWGSDNAWYNIPNLGGTATIVNSTFPYNHTLGTTFQGIGNPALPNSNFRTYILDDVTNQQTYKITIRKVASTGEVLAAQNGYLDIIVEKFGITSNSVFTASNGVKFTGSNIELDRGWQTVSATSTLAQSNYETNTLVSSPTAVSVTLPDPAVNINKIHKVKRMGLGTVTVLGAIDGGLTSVNLPTQYDSLTFESNGLHWYRL
jgi:hypothetical protein